MEKPKTEHKVVTFVGKTSVDLEIEKLIALHGYENIDIVSAGVSSYKHINTFYATIIIKQVKPVDKVKT